ncbi:hypothetical protein COO60DRAFT_1516973 [Scenedesmus sp. NREL 46B-D3]|nr:hypothetical protein COO60DRAFT_1516973 [Scenedesmus sp. NREL 46B-D3]
MICAESKFASTCGSARLRAMREQHTQRLLSAGLCGRCSLLQVHAWNMGQWWCASQQHSSCCYCCLHAAFGTMGRARLTCYSQMTGTWCAAAAWGRLLTWPVGAGLAWGLLFGSIFVPSDWLGRRDHLQGLFGLVVMAQLLAWLARRQSVLLPALWGDDVAPCCARGQLFQGWWRAAGVLQW